MNPSESRRESFDRDLAILLVVAAARLLFHVLTNGAYGFHRDELAVIDDARFLAWGYVAYPPFTPLVGRVAIELFGTSMTGLRFFGALAQCIVMVLAGRMVRQLGGALHFQLVAAVATAIAPMSMIMTSLFQYITFDALWWVTVAWLIVRLVRSDDPRWWVAIGATIGLGMMTKYTMAYWVAGLVSGVFLTRLKSHLRSGWLWLGVVVSLLVFLPNFIWQLRHDFISIEFLQAIHARDVAIGRTEGFVAQQFFVCTSAVTVPLWLAGLWFYLFDREGRRFRVLGWMYVVTFALMIASRARFYYLAPAYPMLFAGGAVMFERWTGSMRAVPQRAILGLSWLLLAVGAVASAALMLPLAPIGSSLWNVTAKVHDNFREELGWQELTSEVARIYESLPEEERSRTGIFTGNYGEAGAINLYGPELGLPTARSGVNSYWYRGFGDPPPETVILLGVSLERAGERFGTCEVAGINRNRHGVENEELRDHPSILLCRDPNFEWRELWPDLQGFG